jgi:ribosomal-protein-alanine N-acetyltransferase
MAGAVVPMASSRARAGRSNPARTPAFLDCVNNGMHAGAVPRCIRLMTADPPVRLARPDDAQDIAMMSRELIEQGLPWTWRPGRVLAALRSPETNVAVVRADSALVAFGIMDYLERHAYLALLAVRPASQRTGVGRALLRWLEASAHVAGAERISVEARLDNVAARSFYNELGYHETGIRRGRYSDGVDGVRLDKWLRAGP